MTTAPTPHDIALAADRLKTLAVELEQIAPWTRATLNAAATVCEALIAERDKALGRIEVLLAVVQDLKERLDTTREGQ